MQTIQRCSNQVRWLPTFHSRPHRRDSRSQQALIAVKCTRRPLAPPVLSKPPLALPSPHPYVVDALLRLLAPEFEFGTLLPCICRSEPLRFQYVTEKPYVRVS